VITNEPQQTSEPLPAGYPPGAAARFNDELLVVVAFGQGPPSGSHPSPAPALPPSHRPTVPPLAQVAEVSDGIQDFSSQLQEDTTEVSRETRETVEQANVQLAHKLERVTEQLDAAQLGQSISTISQQVSICADTATEPPYCCTYGLRVPASCLLCVPEPQGSLLPGRQARYVRRTLSTMCRGAAIAATALATAVAITVTAGHRAGGARAR
jgi:hypothetical protein